MLWESLLFGMMTMLLGSILTRVVLQVISSTYPSCPVSSLIKSPTRTDFSTRIWIPANRLDRVSCRARATARPPTPSAVRKGVIDIPMTLRAIRRPSTRIIPFNIPQAPPDPHNGACLREIKKDYPSAGPPDRPQRHRDIDHPLSYRTGCRRSCRRPCPAGYPVQSVCWNPYPCRKVCPGRRFYQT